MGILKESLEDEAESLNSKALWFARFVFRVADVPTMVDPVY